MRERVDRGKDPCRGCCHTPVDRPGIHEIRPATEARRRVHEETLHRRWIRIWHWGNALLFLVLAVTGLRIHWGGRSRRLGAALQRTARRRMLVLDAADRLNDLLIPPGNRLEKLVGERAGQYCIRINEQWRIYFRWRRGDAHEVEIVDYH